MSDYKQALQQADIVSYVQPNITYDKERSTTELNDLLSSVPLASGMVLSGQKIIDRGEIVNDYSYRVLTSLDRELERRNVSKAEIKNTVIGQFIYVLLLLCLFTCFIVLFRSLYLGKVRSVVMVYVMITIYPVIVSLFMEHSLLSVYIIPFAIGPMFIRVFMDSRTAFIAHLVSMLICAVALKYQFEFILLQLISGLAAFAGLSLDGCYRANVRLYIQRYTFRTV